MFEFFESNGTGRKAVSVNVEALNTWLLRLQQESKNDNAPLKWIQQMLNPSRSNLPAADELFDIILAHEDENAYVGPCCSSEGLSDADSAYRGSVYDNDLTVVRIDPVSNTCSTLVSRPVPVRKYLTNSDNMPPSSTRDKGKFAIEEHPNVNLGELFSSRTPEQFLSSYSDGDDTPSDDHPSLSKESTARVQMAPRSTGRTIHEKKSSGHRTKPLPMAIYLMRLQRAKSFQRTNTEIPRRGWSM